MDPILNDLVVRLEEVEREKRLLERQISRVQGASGVRRAAAHASANNSAGGGQFLPKAFRVLLVATLYSVAMYRLAGRVFGDAFSPSLQIGDNATAAADSAAGSATAWEESREKIRVGTALIIATVPYDAIHARALWSHLECLTEGIDRVLIAAPDALWSRLQVQAIKTEFVRRESNRREEKSNGTNIEVATDGGLPIIEEGYYRNDRYDIGLWCDALHYGYGYNATNITSGSNSSESLESTVPDAVFVVNDSAMSMRKYNNLTRRIVHTARLEMQGANLTAPRTRKQHARLVSLNGRFDDYSSPVPNARYNWVESVYRGLTPAGLKPFYDFSCSPQSFQPCFGAEFSGKRKRCVVDHFERALATRAYDIHTEVDAMFPSYFPHTAGFFPSFGVEWNASEENARHGGFWTADQWRGSGKFYEYLRDEWGFPMKKIKTLRNEVGHCNRLVTGGFLDGLPYPTRIQRFGDNFGIRNATA
ncbi:hypothetical protein ACHAXT_007785 [Thalassiosira profunda]